MGFKTALGLDETDAEIVGLSGELETSAREYNLKAALLFNAFGRATSDDVAPKVGIPDFAYGVMTEGQLGTACSGIGQANCGVNFAITSASSLTSCMLATPSLPFWPSAPSFPSKPSSPSK